MPLKNYFNKNKYELKRLQIQKFKKQFFPQGGTCTEVSTKQSKHYKTSG
jgi:hypothetical protein